MKVSRGDIVLLDFPFASGGGSKVCPALVVQNDVDNRRLSNVIVAMVTSQTKRSGAEPTQLLVDLATPEGKQSGLLMDSTVNCVNLFTVDQKRLLRVLGRLPESLMSRVDACLKAALQLT